MREVADPLLVPGAPPQANVARASEARLDADGLWRALRAIDLEADGPQLLESIAVQAARLGESRHVEIRQISATGDERRACSVAGVAAPDDEHTCCRHAQRLATRLPLRVGITSLGELLVVESSQATAASRWVRRFAALVAGRLEIERLRQEVAIHAQDARHSRWELERIEATLAPAPLMLSIQDRELRYTWIRNMDGSLVEEALGRTDLDLFLAGEAMALTAAKRRVLQTGQPEQVEVPVHVCDRLVTWQIYLGPLRDPFGAIQGVTAAALDVTARAQEAGVLDNLLHQREDERSWLQAAIDRSPVGIFLVETGPEGERVVGNRRAAELVGHPLDPHRARAVLVGRLLDRKGRPLPFESLPSSRALRGERVRMEEFRLRRLDGTELPIVASAGAIVDGDGRRAGAVVTFDDISPFKELERMREEWTSMITHDLRQPISSIAGFAAVLGDHPDLASHLRNKVGHIGAAARRLARMTADLMEASRLESNQLALEREPTDLVCLAREVVERIELELQEHPVCVEAEEGLPRALVDPDRLEQVLGNLLSNAAKYGAPDSAIELRIQRMGNEVAVGVTNQGTGLSVEDMGLLFQRFHRSDHARRSRIRGMGLGLYIARGLVEAHGGRIWAETDGKHSVTFRFALPLGTTS